MRLLPLLALPFLVTAAAAAPDRYTQDRGPGIAGERQGDTMRYPIAGFEKVASAVPGAIDVQVGPAWSVRAVGPAAGFANLRVTVDDGTLQIGHRYNDRDQSIPQERQVRFVVTLPRLAGVAVAGSGHMTVDRVQGTALGVAVGGSGSVALGQVSVDRATVAIGGSGGVTVQGSARSLKATLGGSGSLDAPGLRVGTAQVMVAGSGRVRAAVDGTASVSVFGSGDVDLGPKARCSVSRMSKAAVRCGG